MQAKAIKIEPNCTYVIKCEQVLSYKVKDRLRQNWKLQAPTNTFIILDGGLDLVREEDHERQSEEERSREADINEHIESDWTAETLLSLGEKTDNEEGSVRIFEYNIQHDEAWEDYFRTQGSYAFYLETESTQPRKTGHTFGDKHGNYKLSGRDGNL
jgi:hypothetical protein